MTARALILNRSTNSARYKDNFENVKYFQCNKHRPNKNCIGWICHKSNKRIDPNKTV